MNRAQKYCGTEFSDMRVFYCGCHAWSRILLFFPYDTNACSRTPTWCGVGVKGEIAQCWSMFCPEAFIKKGKPEVLSPSRSQHNPFNRNALCPFHWMWRILIYLQMQLPNSTQAWSRLADSNFDHRGVNYSDWTFTLPALMSVLYTSEPCSIGWARQEYNTLDLLLARDHSLPNQLSKAR